MDIKFQNRTLSENLWKIVQENVHYGNDYSDLPAVVALWTEDRRILYRDLAEPLITAYKDEWKIKKASMTETAFKRWTSSPYAKAKRAEYANIQVENEAYCDKSLGNIVSNVRHLIPETDQPLRNFWQHNLGLNLHADNRERGEMILQERQTGEPFKWKLGILIDWAIKVLEAPLTDADYRRVGLAVQLVSGLRPCEVLYSEVKFTASTTSNNFVTCNRLRKFGPRNAHIRLMCSAENFLKGVAYMRIKRDCSTVAKCALTRDAINGLLAGKNSPFPEFTKAYYERFGKHFTANKVRKVFGGFIAAYDKDTFIGGARAIQKALHHKSIISSLHYAELVCDLDGGSDDDDEEGDEEEPPSKKARTEA
jgi:hypothetical protein